MIEARHLIKHYGETVAVDGISFEVQPGRVTGFLGPNGAGKSTTMRMIVGLDRPTSGTVTVGGKAYREHRSPLTEVGVLLDAKAVHSGRSAYQHLRAMAATHGISRDRVAEVIRLTGLEQVASRRVGGFSLGMGQRLGIAAALLGDPQTLILDEPVNGLDPEGVKWVRTLVRRLADDGRTVFLSSHLMSEMSQTADHLVVIGRGRIIAVGPIDDILTRATSPTVRVATPDAGTLAPLLIARGATVRTLPSGQFEVADLAAPAVGDLAAAHGVALHELTPVRASLEEAFMELTRDAVEYRSEPTAEGISQ